MYTTVPQMCDLSKFNYEVLPMPSFSIELDSATASFYEMIALHTGLPEERVLADALFKLAGELSLEALCKSKGSQP